MTPFLSFPFTTLPNPSHTVNPPHPAIYPKHPRPSHLISSHLPARDAAVLGPGPPAQRIDRLLELEPALVAGPAVRPVRLLGLEPVHGAEDDAGALDADDGHAEAVGHDGLLGFAGVPLDGLHALDGEPDGADAVHGGRGPALLDVARDREAGLEAAL